MQLPTMIDRIVLNPSNTNNYILFAVVNINENGMGSVHFEIVNYVKDYVKPYNNYLAAKRQYDKL